VKQKQPLILLFSTGQVEVGLLLMLTMEEAQAMAGNSVRDSMVNGALWM
jgi:hypothetical protein